MKFIRNLSIRNKLIIIILAIVLSSISILFLTFIFNDIQFFKNEMVSVSRMTAKIVGIDCVPALTFNDVKGGTGILKKLKEIPTVDYACVYDNEHNIFASFGNAPDTNVFYKFKDSYKAKFDERNLYVLEPIEYNGHKYGDIYLRLSTRKLDERTSNHIFIMSLIAVVIVLVAYFLALWLQKLISKPILLLANVTENISGNADYSQRVQKISEDEIGELYDSFNNMLEQIQLRQKERDIAEKALYESEARYRNYINSAPHGVFITNERCEYIEVNDAACIMTGYSKEELLKESLKTVTAPSDLNEVLISFGELKTKGNTVIEAGFITKNGQLRYWEITATRLSSDRFLGFTVDITKRREADEALKKSEKTLSKAQKIARIGSWELNLRTNQIKLSDEMYNIFDFDPDTAFTEENIKQKIYSDDLDYVSKTIDKIRSGVLIPIIEFRIKKTNQDIRYISVIAESVLNENGEMETVTGTAQDITQRKLSEEQIKNQNILLEKAVIKKTHEMEKMMEKLIRQEKLATIGKVSGSIAHEIRNPLGAVKQAVFFLQGKLKNKSEKIKTHLNIIDEELTITDRVITNLLEMTRLEEANKEKINIAELINQAVDRCDLGNKITLKLNIMKNAEFMWADPLQMQQVFVNLIINSSQAMEKKGIIEFKTIKNNHFVKITVTDTGHGMSNIAIKKAFEPLFTTKAKGTGLGLSICKQIIDNHGGEIKISSSVKKGTTISIILPDGAN